MDKALATLARIGTDDAPSVEELQSARDEIARSLHALKTQPSTDLAAVLSLKEAYSTAVAAVEAAEAAVSEQAAELDDLLGDIPNPDADLSAETEESTETPEPEASGRVLSLTEAVARLGLTDRPTAPVTEVEETPDVKFSVQIGNEVKESATWREVAEAFTASGRSLKAGKDRVVRISTEYSADRTLPGTQAANSKMLDSFLTPEAVSAAGGCCSLPTPIYDNPVLSSLGRPIRDSLPTLGQSGRGAVTAFPPVCLPDTGAMIWDCETDALVDPADEDTWKPCLDVTCEDAVVYDTYGVPMCLTVGNFQQRFAPEQWEAYLRALSALQARLAEVELFNRMVAGTTTDHTVDATGSVYNNFISGVARAAALIRQDQRYLDVNINVWAPEWLRTAAREDLRNRRPWVDEPTDALIAQKLSNEGVTVHYSPDIQPLEPAGQVDGPLASYLSTAQVVVAPEGHFSFIDEGTLDLGTEIRDLASNRQNKVSAFAESFEGLIARGCNAKTLEIPVEVCDTAAGCVPAEG